VNEFDEESDESHDGESDGCGNSDLLELLSVRLGTPLHQPTKQDILQLHNNKTKNK
jgi:hypothetical protein